jgi:O-antigen ligase
MLLAALIQVHTTLPFGNIGVRLSLSDLLLPVAFLTSAACFYQQPESHPVVRRALPEFLLLGIATLWLIVALVRGRIEIGHWQSYALLNRGAGWAVMISYFLCGWATAAAWPSTAGQRFMKMLLSFIWVGCIWSAVLMVALSYRWFGLTVVPEHLALPLQQTMGLITGTSRFQGFVVNPNAFGFIAVAAIAMHLPYAKSGALMARRWHLLGLGVSLFGLIWSFSRGAWLAAAFAVILLMLLRRIDYRLFAGAVLIALSLSIAIIYVCAVPPINIDHGIVSYPPTGEHGGATSTVHRWTLIWRTLDLWREAPLLGVGIGVFLDRQTPTGDDPLAAIHSTYLWLLSETGLVGLAIFGAFFLFAFVVLLKRQRDADAGSLLAGAAALLVAFAIIALVMDALYQRHFWLLLGLAFGVVARLRSGTAAA